MAQLALLAAVDTGLSGWTNTPIVTLNTETADDPLATFLEPQFVLTRTERLSVSDRYYREEGYVRFVLGCERGIGLVRPTQWASDLMQRFNDTTLNGVIFKVARSPQIDQNSDTGSYFIVTVLVPYTYDYRD